jgi:hypothetical protein
MRERSTAWRALVAILVLLSPSLTIADTPLPPPALVTRCSANRNHCATADPQADTLTVYEMRGTVRLDPVWSLKGWERDFYLANGGDDMVVCFSGLNLLPLDYKPDWPMLKFYHRGTLVRRVLLRDLILDRSKLQRTVSHYYWGRCRGFGSEGRYEVETVDRGVLRFNVRTGLVEQEP